MIALAILAVLAGALYLLGKNLVHEAEQPTEADGSENSAGYCTMDAKLCADGSYVGRQAPDCDFAPCPGEEGYVEPVSGEPEEGMILTEEMRPEASLAEQIRECLPLSNWEAKETCDRLIASIQTYQDCVEAGFPVLESYPPQCVTPDNRRFTEPEVALPEPQITDESWQEITRAFSACQVKSASQLHSLAVSVTLKDGRRLQAVEPKIDAVVEAAQAAEQSCGDKIPVATE